jgi:hypothetical protein
LNNGEFYLLEYNVVYSLLKVNRRFIGAVLATCFYADFLLALFFDPQKEATSPFETSVDFHGVIFQKIDLFMTTAVRTSDPT